MADDGYIPEAEPGREDKARHWRTAMGLQAVDGLAVSPYLEETAQRHVEGEISMGEVHALLKSYYEDKGARAGRDAARTEEADIVSARITEILGETAFSFRPGTLVAIHRRLFEGLRLADGSLYAGLVRQRNLGKAEWALGGDSVKYAPFADIEAFLEHDFSKEAQTGYAGLSLPQAIKRFSRFIADVWAVHPFREGNTRATAVFAIKYLQAMGFDVSNDMFKGHSDYFRDALARANYFNYPKGVDRETRFLEMFFRNLLMGEKNELRRRDLHVAMAPQ